MSGAAHSSLLFSVLPDVLAPGLAVVFCGSAVGRISAKLGAYYAGPGNRFWPMLHRTGLTPRLLAPHQYASVTAYGIGLTDLAKHASGADSSLPRQADDPARLRAAIATWHPRALAFNGKRAASVVLGHRPALGRQPDRIGTTAVFVLPSTSGAARRWWDERPWFELADLVKRGAI